MASEDSGSLSSVLSQLGARMGTLREKKHEEPSSSIDARIAREKIALAPTDGRRMRRTGRTQQLNLKVRPEFKADIHELARKHKTTIVGVIEMAVELLARHEG